MAGSGMRYLLEALEAGSMRAASDRLNVAASSVSRQISRLEAEVGLPLIDKRRRGIKLTHAGEIIVDHYRKQIADRDAFFLALEELRTVRAGAVAMAVGEGFLGASFSALIAQFRQENPQVRLEIMTGSSQEVTQMVASDEVHMGLAFQTPPDLKIRVRSVIAQPLMAVMLPGHPLARSDKVAIRDLENQPLCLPPKHLRIRQILNAAEARAGCFLEARLETNSIKVMCEMVTSGVALTVLPRVGVWSELESGEMIGLPIVEDAMEETTVSLLLRAGRQLEGAPLRMLKRLEAQMRVWGNP